METMDGEAVFLDTNILVYAKQQQSPFNEAATRRLEQLK
jgi:predicted nucleic acid-binding protein